MKKARFNAFDAVVVLLVLAVCAAGYLYLKKPGGSGAAGTKCQVVFTVEFKWVDESFVDAVRDAAARGDEIKDSVKGYYLGKAFNVESGPDTIINFDAETARFIETESPGKYTVYLSVKGEGWETDDKLTCEGQVVRVGQKMSVKGKGYANIGYVTELYAMKAGA